VFECDRIPEFVIGNQPVPFLGGTFVLHYVGLATPIRTVRGPDPSEPSDLVRRRSVSFE
jgi:hypothetical protein